MDKGSVRRQLKTRLVTTTRGSAEGDSDVDKQVVECPQASSAHPPIASSGGPDSHLYAWIWDRTE